MPVIALSTCWNSPRHTDGYEMLSEIAALGFTHAELSHGIRLSLVPGIVKALGEKLVQITSTHNFCPLPPGVNSAAPNLFTPSSSDPRMLGQWQRYTRRSIDFAQQVGASVVVCHLGSVKLGWFNPAKKVSRATQNKAAERAGDLTALRSAAAGCVAKVKRRKTKFWEQTLASLEELLPYAAERGIAIGAENREKCEELPLDADFAALLERFPAGSGLAYWHDTGHAQLKEKMGLARHEDLLAAHGPRLAGMHIHDVRGFKDHLPPGSGDVDFRMVGRFLRPEHICVLELNPRLSPTEVVDARQHLGKIFAETTNGTAAAGAAAESRGTP